MNSDHLSPDADVNLSPGREGGEDPRRERCYVSAAPLLAVMEEQISYLVSHGGGDCPPGCVDCARLEEAKRCLLRPFAGAMGWARLETVGGLQL